MMIHKFATALVIPIAMGCSVFDENLLTENVQVSLADQCELPEVPTVEIPAGQTETTFDVDTLPLSSFFAETASCTGRRSPGNDGFFKVLMQEGERWHFHVSRKDDDPAVDPAIYVLPGCDQRECTRLGSLDICSAGSDEHFSFVAPSTRDYVVAIDSGLSGGYQASVEVVRPVCGDEIKQHSEVCEDGNTVSGDGCSAGCQVELLSDSLVEAEPNDDILGANILPDSSRLVVQGQIGKRCEVDHYALTWPAGKQLEVAMLNRLGVCDSGTPDDIELALLDESGVVIGSESPEAGEFCPSITQSELLADQPPGNYFLRVLHLTSDPRSFDYRLDISFVDPLD